MSIKMIPSILMSLCCAFASAQEASEIYVFNLFENDTIIRLSDPINISSNPGYDNQPMFTEDGQSVMFASEREDQTDIAQYNLSEGYRTWITNTPDSEYSPAPFPKKKKYFTCVRLNEDNTQHLYKYAFKKKPPEIMLPDLRVGYYLWFNEKTLVSFVIGDIETLQVSNFKYDIRYPIEKNIGRSLQKIPPSATSFPGKMSYISLEHGSPEIYAIDPAKSQPVYITDALEDSQDLVWTQSGSILMGNETGLFWFRSDVSKDWLPVIIESDLALNGFSRLAMSPDGKKIAVVVRE
jgi:hypothetical protein